MRRISPSMLVAIAALVMATTGSAIAAKHYLITSTKQISPKVLKSLHGATGRRGPAGKAGVAGAQGPTGDPGTPGAPGANGTAGPAIATRATGSSVQTTAGGNAIYPLTNNTWTQAADEDDIVIGQVTLQSAPPFGTGANQCDPNGGRGLFVDLYVNDVKISSDLYLNTGVSSTIQLPLPGVKDGFAYAANQTPFALSTGADRTATLTAKIGDDCASGGHYVIAGLRFDVIRIR